MVMKIVIQHTAVNITRCSATAKSTARPTYLVGVLYDISRERENMLMASQLLLRNGPRKLPNSAK